MTGGYFCIIIYAVVLSRTKPKAEAFSRTFVAAASLKAIIKMPLQASIFIYVIIYAVVLSRTKPKAEAFSRTFVAAANLKAIIKMPLQ